MPAPMIVLAMVTPCGCPIQPSATCARSAAPLGGAGRAAELRRQIELAVEATGEARALVDGDGAAAEVAAHLRRPGEANRPAGREVARQGAGDRDGVRLDAT